MAATGRSGPYKTGVARVVTQNELEIYYRRVARNVRDERRARDMTQSALSLATGINKATLCMMEKNAGGSRGKWKHGPLLETIVRIARALDLEPSELM